MTEFITYKIITYLYAKNDRVLVKTQIMLFDRVKHFYTISLLHALSRSTF